MMMVYLGIGQIIEFPLVKIILWSFGCFVLTYTGVESLLTLHKITLDLKSGKKVQLTRSFIAGFFMSLLNPLTILFWLGIYGSVLAETTVTFSGNQILINSVAIIVGIILWDTINGHDIEWCPQIIIHQVPEDHFHCFFRISDRFRNILWYSGFSRTFLSLFFFPFFP